MVGKRASLSIRLSCVVGWEAGVVVYPPILCCRLGSGRRCLSACLVLWVGKRALLSIRPSCVVGWEAGVVVYPPVLCCRFGPMLTTSLQQICGYRQLVADVEGLRRIRYSSENMEHERLLLQVRTTHPPLSLAPRKATANDLFRLDRSLSSQ